MTKEQKEQCRTEFIKYCPDAFRYHHYDLADVTTIKNPLLWREFLLEPDIRAWIESELNIINNSELNKMLKDISKSNSTGAAYIINALQKINEKDTKQKTGPIFVYTYIPLNEQQEQADNVVKLDSDPFLY